MTMFQLIMLGGTAYFAFKVYEHIQTLQEPQNETQTYEAQSADAFSPFTASDLLEKADEAFENQDMQKALAFLLEANTKEAQGSDILFKIGYVLQQLRDFDESLKYYKEALELDKENEFIHNAIASIYRENKEYVSAKMHLNESISIDDKNAVTYYNYGNLLVDMEHFEEAQAMYEKALKVDPDFNEAKEELAKLS